MFGFNKTKKKADDAIDEASTKANDIFADAKELLNDSKKKIKLIAELGAIALTFNITVSALAFAGGLKIFKLLQEHLE